MATNKALALSARTETKDYVDIAELSRIYPLETIVEGLNELIGGVRCRTFLARRGLGNELK